MLGDELLRTLAFCARYYHAPPGEVLATALPAGLREGLPLPETTSAGWQATDAGRLALARPGRGRPRQLLERLAAAPASEDELEAQFEGWRAAARTLQSRGEAGRVPLSPRTEPLPDHGAPVPTSAQAEALAALRAGSGFRACLLEGVTGSGKTEVYLQAIRDCVESGRQALVLVPEIGLTPQTLQRFRARLGGLPVWESHSGLSDGERARAWAAMARGEGRVLVGTRSAVFAPLPLGGLIVVDEEHDASYKQQDGIRYHARDVALVRARALEVPILLGSATPSLESLHNAHAGRYQLLRLPRRAGGAKPPTVRVLDVRKRLLVHGLSEDAYAAVAACLARGEQALVFRNRRGYAPVLLCHDCGWRASCKRCDSALTVHGAGRSLLCHHCGARATRPLACPDCASLGLQPQGFGTERLEEALAARFPDAQLLRVDRGSTRRRGALEAQLRAFGNDPGILVGTQMLAKGHDLPRLTLVVVVGVDEGLFSADFRAGEKLAQLLVQVAGRAGRAERPGEVLLQTHHPGHALLATLLGGGYPAVAALALAEREAAGFPPYAHLAMLRAEAIRESDVQTFLGEAHACLPAVAGVHASTPMPAPMPRRAGRARWQMLLTAQQRPALHALLTPWVAQLYELKSARRARWSLDVDPIDLY